jgi:two-component system NarL family sensor kinase
VAELTDVTVPSRLDLRLAVAWAGGALIAVLAAGAVAFEIANGGSETPGGLNYVPAITSACLAFGLPGALVLAQGRAVRIGALTMLIGVSFGLTGVATGWAVRAVGVDPGSLPAGEAAIWLCNWAWVPGYCAIPILLLYLPDDRLPSPRWRPLVLVAIAGIVLLAVGTAVSPYALDDLPLAFGEPVNPLAVEELGTPLTTLAAVLLVACTALALASIVLRFRRATGTARDQLKWVALGGAATVVILAASFAAGEQGDVVAAVGMVPLPASVAVAVLRHRMWDVDLVINRSLVYAALTVIVVAVYVALVSVIGELVDDTVAGIVAVGLVAVALQPLHGRLQRAANQLVYGDRDDPGAALRRLGQRLVAADEVLPAVAETVARALRLPYVAVAVDGGPVASHGKARRAERIQLRYRGQRVGELAAAPREPGRGFAPADRRALEAIANQVAAAAHAVALTADLRRSRERLVLAREEERRRLRHDLHDELGPALAALALELESARDLVRARPEQVEQALDRAAARARDGVADVRRLVYDLRPPTLDDLGLAGALEQRAAQLSGGSLRVSVDAPAGLGPLPAAVESAAYRIASEALANSARHAGARVCTVTLAVERGALELRVADDGRGIAADAVGGVGLRSMRERAEELGGTLAVTARPAGGTEVVTTIPLGEPS